MQSSWQAVHLAQQGTGAAIRRRVLYTTNEEIRYIPTCWIALTSKTPSFLNGRDDVLDRTLIFQTTRLRFNTPEHELLDRIERYRDILWSELLQELNEIVAYFRHADEHPSSISFRMADFAAFCLGVGKAQGERPWPLASCNLFSGSRIKRYGCRIRFMIASVSGFRTRRTKAG